MLELPLLRIQAHLKCQIYDLKNLIQPINGNFHGILTGEYYSENLTHSMRKLWLLEST